MKNIILMLDWYEMRIHKGLMRYARDHDWLIHSNQHSQDLFINFRVDVLVVSKTKNPEKVEGLIESINAPSVTLFGKSHNKEIPCILQDDRAIGESAADLFVKRGFRNFAIIFAHPFNPPSHIARRIDGFEKKVKQMNGNIFTGYRKIKKKRISTTGENRSKINYYKKEIEKCQLPLAVFLLGDGCSNLLQSACFELGLSIPQDVAMISVNNDPMICPYTPVPMSSIDPGWENIGYSAGVLLDKLMNGEKLSDQEYLIQPLGVVERMSSNIVAVEDRRVADAIMYIERNLEKDPTLEDICDAIKVSKTNLKRAFRKYLGHGIKREVQLARIRKIKELLLGTDMSSVQIAQKLNFSSEFYLYKFFKDYTEMTTKEFRKTGKID